MHALTIIHLCAPNDRNGNPRRIFLVMAGGEVLHAIDEGYRGFGAVKAALPQHLEANGLRVACEISIPPAEYREWKQTEYWIEG